MLRELAGDRFEAFSAGAAPTTQVHPFAPTRHLRSSAAQSEELAGIHRRTGSTGRPDYHDGRPGGGIPRSCLPWRAGVL
ncbi:MULTISPECIES: hypothetical protein [Paraburkholderia]|uniref:hypothetical protein n=1 Tax=Paraburkholderia TaxID=1822464 RepID=UPI001FE7A49B|nr:hypothetical protein [Paraburkholderia podalyriae]